MSHTLRSALTGVALAVLVVFAFGYFAVDIAQSQTEGPTEDPSDPSEDPSDPLPLPTIPGGDDQVTTDRLDGQTRFETSVAISQEAFPDGADDVFLARADEFADALSAGSLTTGPILLVEQCGDIPDVIVEEIERLEPARVVALGGDAAVCEQVLEDAAAAAAGEEPTEEPTASETPTEDCGDIPIIDECPEPSESPTEAETPTETETPTA